MTFLDAGTPIGMAAQQASPYTFNATGLAPGPHPSRLPPGRQRNLSSTSNTVSVSITAAAQTITFSSLAGKSYGTAPFTVSATASSGLPVSFASTTSMVCTVAGATVTLVAVGTCTIQATQAGDSNYAAATPVSQHFTVTQGGPDHHVRRDSQSAGWHSALDVDCHGIVGSGSKFHSIPADGMYRIGRHAHVGRDGHMHGSGGSGGKRRYTAAPSVSQHFTVAPSGQTITFGALANQVFGVPPSMLSATASSGLAVTFASSTAAVCTVSGSTVTLVSVGMCTIKASQAGNSSYAAATPVSQTFNITQGSQTIVFSSLADKSLGGPHFTVSATASSGLTVAFVSNTVPVCTVSGATVTLVAMGSCTLEAQQAGNANYAAAAPVDQSFQVTAGSQTITFGALSTKSISAGTITLSATASSSLPVSFASNTPSVCTVSGNIVTLVITGTCTIEASQAGNASYAAATPVDQSFMVTQGSQTIAFGALSSQPFSATPVTLTATASSGLPVNFTSGSTGICTVAGSSVTLVTVGTCTIQASRPETPTTPPLPR